MIKKELPEWAKSIKRNKMRAIREVNMKAIVLVFQGCVEKVAVVPDKIYDKVVEMLPSFSEGCGVVNNELYEKIEDLLKLHFVDGFTSVEMG